MMPMELARRPVLMLVLLLMIVRAAVARAHHWLEMRHRPAAIRDQNRFPRCTRSSSALSRFFVSEIVAGA
jgi:hypothetical protein